MSEKISATYLIETSHQLDRAASILAGEQSCGTFVKTPGETAELTRRHRAHVESIEIRGTVDQPSLPYASRGPNLPIHRATIEVSWPLDNVGVNLPMLFSTVAGNLFELAPFSALRLLDIDVPSSYATQYPGPKYGIEETRSLCQVFDRPIIGTIIKPSVGLSAEATADHCKKLIDAGLDFIKDDELQGNAPHCPFEQRVERVMYQINQHADRTGKKPMYAFNITGDIDSMKQRHDLVISHGGTCAMLNINWVGITGVLEMAKFTQIPLHGHRNGWGLFSRSPDIGIGFSAYQKLWRLAGIDHLHTNGIRNKFCEDDDTVLASIRSCLAPFHGQRRVMPVLSSGQWADQVHDTYQAIASTDLMYLCGGGIMAHPGGIAAGAASIQQAWQAALSQISLQEFAGDHQELATAIEFFGNKT